MNDVARIVKQRVNEEVLPTGIDLDVELDKFEEENSFEFKLYISDDKNNQYNKTINGTSDIKINALLFWAFLRSTKLFEKKIKNVQTKVTIDNVLYNKVYSHVFRDQETYNTIASKLINDALNYARYNDRSGSMYNKVLLFFKALYNFCINYKFTKKFTDEYSYEDFMNPSMNKKFHDYAPNDILLNGNQIGINVTISNNNSQKSSYQIWDNSLGEVLKRFNILAQASIDAMNNEIQPDISKNIYKLKKRFSKFTSENDALDNEIQDNIEKMSLALYKIFATGDVQRLATCLDVHDKFIKKHGEPMFWDERTKMNYYDAMKRRNLPTDIF